MTDVNCKYGTDNIAMNSKKPLQKIDFFHWNDSVILVYLFDKTLYTFCG